MRTRRLVALLVVAALAGCADPAPAPAPPPAPSRFVADRAVLRALGDWVQAGYELRLRHDLEAHGQPPAGDVQALEDRLALARDQLRATLREAGADAARVEREEELLPLVHEGVARGGRYAFVFPQSGDSFAIVRVREELGREVRLFGAPFRYRVTAHDETLVDDYVTWRARALGTPLSRPATYSGALRDGQWTGEVRLDLAAIRAIGEAQWLPQVEALRAAARQARDPAAFVALAEEAHHPELLGLARAALRWRSLEALWSLLGSRPREEQLAKFVEDYAARAELRAAAELRELARLRPAGDERPLAPEERATLLELGALSAMVNGEPLSVAADLLALAAASLSVGGPDEPTALAARRLVVALARRAGPAGAAARTPEDDARDLAALAAASAEDLRAWAAALHAERVAALGG